jgi:hypothetical protein
MDPAAYSDVPRLVYFLICYRLARYDSNSIVFFINYYS